MKINSAQPPLKRELIILALEQVHLWVKDTSNVSGKGQVCEQSDHSGRQEFGAEGFAAPVPNVSLLIGYITLPVEICIKTCSRKTKFLVKQFASSLYQHALLD